MYRGRQLLCYKLYQTIWTSNKPSAPKTQRRINRLLLYRVTVQKPYNYLMHVCRKRELLWPAVLSEIYLFQMCTLCVILAWEYAFNSLFWRLSKIYCIVLLWKESAKGKDLSTLKVSCCNTYTKRVGPAYLAPSSRVKMHDKRGKQHFEAFLIWERTE